MASRPDTDDYLNLFLNDVPLMDVRAPVEFGKGSFPSAENAPLMNDEERHRVGICYKEKGQDKAIELGHQLVCGDVKAQRIEAWKRFTTRHPKGYLFCFRGGLRSRLTQEWIRDAGIDYPLVKGGYKALRRFLIDTFEDIVETAGFRILSGRTGTGKTRVLHQLPNPVDLEGIANHRGSSFGRQVTPQPAQIDFENRLAVAMLKAHHKVGGPMYLEDESRLIGRCSLPESLRTKMAQAPLLVLERPLPERVDIIRADYVEGMLADYVARDGEEAGWLNFRDYLLSAIDRIRKRLGGERHQKLRALMEQALDQQGASGSTADHDAWIESLLRDYYDPMYDYQLSQKEGRILVRGGPDTITDYAKNQHPR
ncbi:tRNA 2-selenouridine(34) synthase MnmH [Marinobacter persicus]|uniref:tRNA 2-selenouridine synthase n=1 Tax=Marinobacter persicus TaxID=930118 RepID=A0A2S6G4U3_9GAMM|nr:tRNA 2-selenouridine(34) synthase MnmH [Marinobacter persicus]PPK50719.1 tRNA 2-selenouridine synthase [Marinobacter persicus]PPK54117.1 tRNA 2-selenouridine synthase [Marinobacter persicus]PPK57304.1 tRNA 2-selenouridine synthase [Marinobacter persicus]